jgi:hypothetical protein
MRQALDVRLSRRIHSRCRGISLVWAIICMVALLGFVSLAVDVGRVQTAKTELRRAADAAARYGVTGINDNSYRTKAIAAAADNKVDGVPLELKNGDVTLGTWSSGTFTSGGSAPNAVQVRARRTTGRGNPIPLMFATIIGRSGCDIEASAIAAIPAVSYGVVGLNAIAMSGNTSTSYWSSAGTVTNGPYGSIASNGAITLSGSTYINGDARPGVGQIVNGAAGRVAGNTTPLTAPMNFPNGDGSAYATVNDNAAVPQITGAKDFNVGAGVTATVPAGNYYLHDFNLSANGTMNVTGQATFYVYNNLTLSGTANTAGNLPKNLKIVMIGDPGTGKAGKANLSGTSALYATLYAPQSPVALSGTGDFYGSILGQSITMTGTSAIHYDLSLTGSTGMIQLVK